jgi:methyl-accepting chemotaxis protein
MTVIRHMQHRELVQLAARIRTGIDERSAMATAQAYVLTGTPWVKEAFRREDRETLKRMLVPVYELLRDKLGAAQAQFHRPDLSSFLRLHQPDRFDDDLSLFRETVKRANREKKPQEGPEIGRAGVGIRGVVPVHDREGHIGTFEVGFDFAPLLDKLKLATQGADIALFINKNKLEKLHNIHQSPTSANGSQSGHFINGFQCINVTHWDVFDRLLSPQPEILAGVIEPEYYPQLPHAENKGLLVIPLKDFSDRPIGVVAGALDMSFYRKQSKRILYQLVVSASFAFLAMICAILLIFNGMILRPMAEVDKTLEQLAAGDTVDKPDKHKCNPLIASIFDSVIRLQARIREQGDKK